MKQEEKTKRTYERILNAALAEFGTKSYENASLNTICSANQISKGLIYHNFKNKDELYLQCVRVCFDDMTAYLKNADYQSGDTKENLQRLLSLRQKFFQENPYYSNLFFETILQPPRHLLEEIKVIRRDFDEFHAVRYRELIGQLELREGITDDEAMEYFFLFQEMFNGYFQRMAYGGSDLNALAKKHESRLPDLLNIMLYGIAKDQGV